MFETEFHAARKGTRKRVRRYPGVLSVGFNKVVDLEELSKLERDFNNCSDGSERRQHHWEPHLAADG